MCFCSGYQLGGSNAEGLGQYCQGGERGLALCPLDAANVVAVHA